MGRSKSPQCLACERPIFSDACDERPLVCVFHLTLKDTTWTVRARHNRFIGFSAKNGDMKVKGPGNHYITPQDIIGVAHEECVLNRMPPFDVYGNIDRSDARTLAQRALRAHLSRLQSA